MSAFSELEKLAPALDMSRSKLIDTALEVGLWEVESFQVNKILPQGYVLGMLKAKLNKRWRMTFARSQGALNKGEILIKRIFPAEKAY